MPSATNDIATTQNLDVHLRQLAAQRQAYTDAKRFIAVGFLSVITMALFGPAAVWLTPNAQPWVAIAAVAILLADAFGLEMLARSRSSLAAKIQELFDTQVLQLDWNDVRASTKPDAGVVSVFADRYLARFKSFDAFVDWYPPACSRLPLDQGRLVCQRANVVWDSALRREWCAILFGALALATLASLSIGLALDWHLRTFIFAAVAPLVPLAVRVGRAIRLHYGVISRESTLRSYLDKARQATADETNSPTHAGETARRVQDEIFDRRKTEARVPDWYYNLRKARFEAEMQATAREDNPASS